MGNTEHPTRNDKIETLTDRILNWYGFTHKSDFRMRPAAMSAAIKLHDQGDTPDTLTAAKIEAADIACGAVLSDLWAFMNPAPPVKL